MPIRDHAGKPLKQVASEIFELLFTISPLPLTIAGGTAAQAASQISGQFDTLGTGPVQLLPEGLARFFHLLHCLDHLLWVYKLWGTQNRCLSGILLLCQGKKRKKQPE